MNDTSVAALEKFTRSMEQIANRIVNRTWGPIAMTDTQEKRAVVGRRVIDALFEMLPPQGSDFPVDERLRWLRAVDAALHLTYKIEGTISLESEEPLMTAPAPAKPSTVT